MATLKERVDKHDRQLAGIQKLITQGMRWIADNQRELREQRLESRREHAEIRKELRELAAAQKRTETSLGRFINSMLRGNGHEKDRVME